MVSDERKRGTYKKYLNVENPEQLMPKTSKWRRNKRLKIAEESKLSSENSELTSDCAIIHEEISEIPAEPEGEYVMTTENNPQFVYV